MIQFNEASTVVTPKVGDVTYSDTRELEESESCLCGSDVVEVFLTKSTLFDLLAMCEGAEGAEAPLTGRIVYYASLL